MSVYVGIDRHRKRSQVAVWNRGHSERCNRNVRNDSPELMELLGGLPVGSTPHALGARRRILKQRRLPDARLSPQHQRRAFAAPRRARSSPQSRRRSPPGLATYPHHRTAPPAQQAGECCGLHGSEAGPPRRNIAMTARPTGGSDGQDHHLARRPRRHGGCRDRRAVVQRPGQPGKVGDAGAGPGTSCGEAKPRALSFRSGPRSSCDQVVASSRFPPGYRTPGARRRPRLAASWGACLADPLNDVEIPGPWGCSSSATAWVARMPITARGGIGITTAQHAAP